MSIDKETMEKLARLARLSFTPEELETFAGEFDDIIAFANTINETVEGDTAALKSVAEEEVAFAGLRDDEVRPSLPNEKIVSNVEDADGFFAVKKSKMGEAL